MTPRIQLLLSLTAASVLVGTAIAQTPPPQGGRKFKVEMSGQQEVNAANPNGGAGDPDGTGTAEVTLNPGQHRICWKITVDDIAPPTRGHIHKAPALVNGPILVTFFEIGDVRLEGCTSTTQPVNAALLKDIIQNPQGYYVNIHNADFGAGAIRGQMKK